MEAERINQIASTLAGLQTQSAERSGLIVTFLALLEMIRLKLIRVFQSGAMGPIRVYKRARPADAPKPLLDPEQRHAEAMDKLASEE